MANDNAELTNNGVVIPFATRKINYSGQADQNAQAVGLVSFAGSDDAKTGTDVPLPTALGANGGLKVDPLGTQTVAGSVTANAGTNLNTSALALESTSAARSTLIGAVTEVSPATDTASSGLNGRLQRIAQRLTALIALFPGALGANGGFKIEGVASGVAVPVSGSLSFSAPAVLTHPRISTADTNPTVVKNSPGTLYSVHIFNPTEAPVYWKAHNTASSPTAGSGVIFPVGCQAGGHRDFVLPIDGRDFSTGIAYTLVGGSADADSSVVAAGVQVVVGYI